MPFSTSRRRRPRRAATAPLARCSANIGPRSRGRAARFTTAWTAPRTLRGGRRLWPRGRSPSARAAARSSRRTRSGTGNTRARCVGLARLVVRRHEATCEFCGDALPGCSSSTLTRRWVVGFTTNPRPVQRFIRECIANRLAFV